MALVSKKDERMPRRPKKAVVCFGCGDSATLLARNQEGRLMCKRCFPKGFWSED